MFVKNYWQWLFGSTLLFGADGWKARTLFAKTFSKKSNEITRKLLVR